MGTDLHQPLGHDRKDRTKTGKSHVSLSRFVLALGICGVVGLSLYASMTPTGLAPNTETQPVAQQTADSTTTKPLTEAEATAAKDKEAAQKLVLQSAQSGANVQRTITEDGAVVTTFSPKDRGDKDPVLLNADQDRVEDPRFAGQPNEALLEDTIDGKLPIIAADGLKSSDYYARPWSGARGTRIAILIGGLGLSQTGTQRAIKDLPEEISLGFAASGNSLQRWMQEARRNGHEILLQVPMEPFDYPDNDPGPDTLLTSKSAETNLANLHHAMAQISNYTGVVNFLGGRFLSDADALEPVLRDISERGLLFLDDGSSAQSLSGTVAKALDMPHAFADVQLDNQLDHDSIVKKLDELERIANRKGTAIAVGSAFDETIDAVAGWSEEAAKRGIEIVGISSLAGEPTQQQ